MKTELFLAWLVVFLVVNVQRCNASQKKTSDQVNCTGSTNHQGTRPDMNHYIVSKWAFWYRAIRRRGPQRCFTNSPGEVDLFWESRMLGPLIDALTEDEFLQLLADAYATDPEGFRKAVAENSTLGTQYMDANNDTYISQDEYLVVFLCIGVNLDTNKRIFNSRDASVDGIPVEEFSDQWVEYVTEPVAIKEKHSLFVSMKLSAAGKELCPAKANRKDP